MFLTIFVDFFFADIRTTIISIFIGFSVYKLSKFYLKVLNLPPGPTPLPLLGNLLLLRSEKPVDQIWRDFSKRYGPVFTFWLGTVPIVCLTDIDIGREAFRRNDFAGRDSFLCNEKHQDVVFSDFGHQWEALRRVAHSAAQKYSTNEKLVILVSDCVDYITKIMINKEGVDKEFSPKEYIYLLFLNILANSAFGESYKIEDEEFKKLKYALDDFSKESKHRFAFWEVSALFRLIDYKMVSKHKRIVNELIDMSFNKFKEHYKEYNESIERDFCDALITAKNEALREGKESAPYLKDENLGITIFDLFLAGTETSQMTFQWILLFICYYPEIQNKLRQEIETQIGDRIATHEDRNRCHYVMAFISEILRHRNVAQFGVPHKAIVKSKIGDYQIERGTCLLLHQGIIMTDENCWPKENEFKPERFLENGKYVTTRPKAYIPFGVGRRNCLGEKLAIADLFLVLVRFLQSTTDYELVLGSNAGIDADPNVMDKYAPHDYKIILQSKPFCTKL